MAVVQISKVQVRRGLQQDLPQLSGGEFGWSLDEQRLFIGNGSIGEGAPEEGCTEILTLRRLTQELPNAVYYTFMGQEGGYIVQTGPDLNHPTIRTFQRKLDNWVSVRDFGAIGDGVVDDTDAINRAIQQIYNQARLQNSRLVRRTLKLEGGTYKVSDTIKVPPWLNIIGDGINNTVIKQVSGSADSVFRTADSSYVSDGTIGSGDVSLPQYITVNNLTIQNDNDRDIFVIDSGNGIYFDRVGFQGPLNNPTTSGTAAGVTVLSTAATSKDINFNSCDFNGVRNGFTSNSLVNDIKFSNCTFNDLYKGIVLGQYSDPGEYPTNVRIFNSYFQGIADRAIDAYNGSTGVTSIGNHYADVGNNFTGTPVSTIINFVSGGNYSIGDTFDRNSDSPYARVWLNNAPSITLDNATGLTIGAMTIGAGAVFTLADNTINATNTGIQLTSPCVFNYSITRDNTSRTGTIRFSNDGSGPEYNEIYTESKITTGVTLDVNTGNFITYKTTSTGYDGLMKYNISNF